MSTGKSRKGPVLTPTRELIATQAMRLGITNPELAEKLGYASSNANFISMLKSGAARLPFDKIAPLASALQIDPLYLARCVSAESKQDISGLLDAISKRTPITLNEEKLIQRMRHLSDGLDIDTDDFPQLTAEMLAIFETMVRSTRASFDSDIQKIKQAPKSALHGADRRMSAET